MRRIGSHFSYANVAATLALVFAIGGGTAAALQGHNSVRSDDIKNGQVKSADLKNNGVKGVDVNEGTLTGVAHEVASGTTVSPGAVTDGFCTEVQTNDSAIKAGDRVVVSPAPTLADHGVAITTFASNGFFTYAFCNLSGSDHDYGSAPVMHYSVLR